MGKINDGGPAYPCPAVYVDENTSPREMEASNAGMSLRDVFACNALTGLLAAEADAEGRGVLAWDEETQAARLRRRPASFAVPAYQLADAMIAAREAKAT